MSSPRPRRRVRAAVSLVSLVGYAGGAAAAPQDVHVAAPDRIRRLQSDAEAAGRAWWGYWGDQPQKYVSHSSHSNRLIPVYAFGTSLAAVSGSNSVYRDPGRLTALYGRMPDRTLNPAAEYFDQTDIYRLQMAVADAGKTRIVLVVFDGMDWHTTRLAAIASRGRVDYAEGRGTGFAFQDYRGALTDFGFCVTSPANAKTQVDVDAQAVRNPGGEVAGGYDPSLGGQTPWDRRASVTYLIGKDRDVPHAYTDSAASAASLCTGCKTYNDSINVAVDGRQLEPIARTLQAHGFAVGAVSSVPASHATPACSYANNVSRDDYQDIARDLVGLPSIAHRDEPLSGLDVVIGGGFGVAADPEKDKDQGANLEPGLKYVADSTLAAIDAARGGRYRLAMRTAGRAGSEVLAEAAADAIARQQRLFGFFGAGEGHLPFQTANGDYDPAAGNLPTDDESVDALRRKYGSAIRYSEADIAENPSLAEMATAAMDVLASRGKFWLMVEAGEVDWASHANNIDNCIGAVRSGDAAVRAVFEWIERHDAWAESVVIVTSDHGHAFVLTEPDALSGGP
ncbi:MAG: alkaline phosphatase [Planctomycetota bacterium]